MKNYLLIMFTIIFLNGFSQNFIYNGGFEWSNTGNSWPTKTADADKLANWKTRTEPVGTTDFHSPDWIHLNGSGVQTIKGVHPPIHTGNGMIGLTNYEVIQQEFDNGNPNFEDNTYYTVSMWVYMPSSGSSTNCRLKLILGKNELKYRDENPLPWETRQWCGEKYVEFSNSLSSWFTIGEFDFSNLGLPLDTWNKISCTFKTPGNVSSVPNPEVRNYDYFAMELRKNGYDPSSLVEPCENGYIFIDDVSMVKTSFCNAACSPNLGPITHGTIPNACVTNRYADPQYTYLNYHFTVSNAIGIEFAVYDRWGIQISNTETAFDPNGLLDVGYSNYYFAWNALDKFGAVLPDGVYTYTLKIWNCHDTKNYNGSLTILNTGYPGSLGSNTINFNLNDCCPNTDKYIQNVTYVGNYMEAVKGTIYAGSNVTSSVANGDVVVMPNVDVKYLAKTISLQTGFIATPGSVFTAIPTDDCIYKDLSSRKARRERPESDDNTLFSSIEDDAIFIYPNPSAGLFSFKPLKSDIESLEIYNYNGSKILSYDKSNFNLKIDLQDYANGTYFYKALLQNGKTATGKLIKLNQ